jgi:hypothetical protein
MENFSHNDYCEQKQSIILLLVCFVFVAMVVGSENETLLKLLAITLSRFLLHHHHQVFYYIVVFLMIIIMVFM